MSGSRMAISVITTTSAVEVVSHFYATDRTKGFLIFNIMKVREEVSEIEV